VSQQTVQMIIALVGCVTYLVVIHTLSRKQRLTFRYAVGWLTLGIFGLVSISMIPFASRISDLVRVSPAAVVAVGAVAFFLTIAVQLSISISGLQHQVQRMAEEIAILSMRQDDNN
jgi:hypothetical protein